LARALRCRVQDLSAPAGSPVPSLDPSLRFRFKRKLKRRLAKSWFERHLKRRNETTAQERV
jgi:hypothetical protein